MPGGVGGDTKGGDGALTGIGDDDDDDVVVLTS